jgi:hypothetical protein
MTKEHVWPEWVENLVPPEIRSANHNYTFRDSEGGEFRRIEGQPVFDLRVREVCEPCNTEWMSRAESGAKSYALGMLQGRRRELHPLGQARLAFWAVLKGLVGQRSFRNRPLLQGTPSNTDYTDLYELRDQLRPPDQFSVFTAEIAWSPGERPGLFRLNGIARTDIENWEESEYLLTYTVLNLAVFVFRSPGDDRPDFTKLGHGPSLTKSVRQIWPTGKTFSWPPGPALTGAGLAALAGGE